jgi:hypothetical protein
MAKQIKADEKTLQPIKLNVEQIEELDRLIDSLKKEIIFPKKSPEKEAPEMKKDDKHQTVFTTRTFKDT